MSLDYHAFDAPWWPFLFVLLAGWLPTDVWRWIGVLSAGRIDETSPLLSLARAVATALVAAVIARLVLVPSGSLAEIPLLVRAGALAGGFAAYLLAGKRTLVGIAVAESILIGVPLALR